MKKVLFLCLTCFLAISSMAQDYVDLGLPSGTLWKKTNEKGLYLTYDEAITQFGDKLPTLEQFAELKAFCAWEWNGKGCVVTGDNGNSIILQAAGYRYCQAGMIGVGTCGLYWSSTPYDSNNVYYLFFDSIRVDLDDNMPCLGGSVRLVQ